ncbi:hypothetical protein M885DRAFT_585728 [Pelagophyceae sp. CCMP2097]|nr:hypothetical protein M885DRAFT_585728 [Pelagophyceae sp. CCMP2097]
MLLRSDAAGGVALRAGGNGSEWVFEAFDGSKNAVAAEHRSKSGRRVVLQRDVSAGCVLREPALAAVVLRLHRERTCANCFARAAKRLNGPRCATCDTHWCTKTCAEQDDHPAARCDALKALGDVEVALQGASQGAAADGEPGDEAAVGAALDLARDVDLDAVALAVRLWTSQGDALQRSEALCDHEEALRAAAFKGDPAAEAVLRRCVVGAALVARALQADAASVATTLLRIRLNAHPFEGGLALFERASAMNHSCTPNVAVSICAERSPGREAAVFLEARTTAASKADTELLCSYVSARVLLAPAAARQEALQTAFDFKCQCPRCRAASDTTNAPRMLRVRDALAAFHRGANVDSAAALDAAAAQLGGNCSAAAALEASNLAELAWARSSGALGSQLFAARAELRLAAARMMVTSASHASDCDALLLLALSDFESTGPRNPLAAAARTLLRRNDA